MTAQNQTINRLIDLANEEASICMSLAEQINAAHLVIADLCDQVASCQSKLVEAASKSQREEVKAAGDYQIKKNGEVMAKLLADAERNIDDYAEMKKIGAEIEEIRSGNKEQVEA